MQHPVFTFFVLLTGHNVLAAPADETPSLHVSFERYVATMKQINSSPELRRLWAEHVNEIRDPVEAGVRAQPLSLSCSGKFRSDSKPSSAHQLRIGDIDVVASLGDSLTAGNGVLAWTIIGCLTEYRGRSWSIGGDSTYANGVTTMPNILRLFNPNVKGFSLGNGDVNSAGSKLNVAVPGNIAQDMPRQAYNLIDRLRSNPSIDYDNDWKLVTLFIGGNNLCAYCEDLNAHSAETYVANIAQALDILHANVPRMFVNLVEMFDITPVAQLANGIICNMVHGSVCGCGHGADADVDALSQLSKAYQRAVQQLVATRRYDTRRDFTVVIQPFFRETKPPSKNGAPDMSYFSPDCFHFSSKGQNGAGKALWNTMLQPVAQKQIEWALAAPVLCPVKDFIPTYLN